MPYPLWVLTVGLSTETLTGAKLDESLTLVTEDSEDNMCKGDERYKIYSNDKMCYRQAPVRTRVRIASAVEQFLILFLELFYHNLILSPD